MKEACLRITVVQYIAQLETHGVLYSFKLIGLFFNVLSRVFQSPKQASKRTDLKTFGSGHLQHTLHYTLF